MTFDIDPAPQPSPWLSVWLRPRVTIKRILATNPRQHVLLLASLGMVYAILAQCIGFGLTVQLLDGRAFAIAVLVGAIFGIANLYIFSLFLTWSGKLLGGRATPLEIRAALAWGAAPNVIGLVVCLVALLGLKVVGIGAFDSITGTLNIALSGLATVLYIRALLITLLMLERVQGFRGAWRGGANLVLAFVMSILIAALIRTFLFQPFSTPSQSMMPTLLKDDQFIVSKFTYGYSHYSIPYSPRLFSGRVLGPSRSAAMSWCFGCRRTTRTTTSNA